jgi:hypothetical protein
MGQTKAQAQGTAVLFFSTPVLARRMVFFLVLPWPVLLVLDPDFLPLDLSFEPGSGSGSESVIEPELRSLLVVTKLLCMTHVRRRLGKIRRIGRSFAVETVPERKSARLSTKDNMSGVGNEQHSSASRATESR